MSNMNRRDFLKGAALGALGLSTLGVSAFAEEKGIYTPAPIPRPPMAWARSPSP